TTTVLDTSDSMTHRPHERAKVTAIRAAWADDARPCRCAWVQQIWELGVDSASSPSSRQFAVLVRVGVGAQMVEVQLVDHGCDGQVVAAAAAGS
ncbi:MAG: hypothetical protein LC799_28460, partial [Actinobacteria bacterium]|nr:hypothetical protein [Actinomycetota bacterium]